MEYYGLSKGTRIEILKPRKLVEQYCELLIRQNDHAFSGKLLRKLSVQQNQSIRKLFPKSKAQRDRESMIGKSNGIWEHPIPIRYVCKVLTELVSQGNIKTVSRFLDRICLVNQVFLTSEEDACVNALYRDSMPEGWGWESPYSDVYIRYHSAGLLVENLLSKHSLNEIK